MTPPSQTTVSDVVRICTLPTYSSTAAVSELHRDPHPAWHDGQNASQVRNPELSQEGCCHRCCAKNLQLPITLITEFVRWCRIMTAERVIRRGHAPLASLMATQSSPARCFHHNPKAARSPPETVGTMMPVTTLRIRISQERADISVPQPARSRAHLRPNDLR